jgi:hypothetical protein
MSRVVPLLCLTVVLLAGCGSAKKDEAAPAPRSAAKPEDFPAARGMTFQDVKSRYPESLAVGVGSSVLRKGRNRVPFLVLDKGARPVRNAAVALYTMRNDGTGVRGPFAAREEPFDIKPAFLSRTTASDPDQERQFYVTDVPAPGPKPMAIFGLVKMDGRLVATSPAPLGVKLAHAPPPDVGDRAISMHTLTPDDVAGDLSKITTRVPPDADLVADDFADVLGKKPVVLVMATPALCQSRVCGPDVDVAQQVASEVGDRASFIHQEIYVDNQPNKGLRPQVLKWRLESEPWIFVIDRTGKITARVEGAISTRELRALVDEVL